MNTASNNPISSSAALTAGNPALEQAQLARVPRVPMDAPRDKLPLDEIVSRFKDQMRLFYIGDLPYHNWQHAEEVYARAMKLTDLCEKFGITVNREAVACAAWGHDAWFLVPPNRFGFRTKEELAAHFVKETLRELGAPRWFAETVQGIIDATNVFTPPRTVEQIIIRASDLGNIGGPYVEFRKNTDRLFEETKLLSGREMSFADWAPRSMRFLALYLWPFLQLTPAAVDDRQASVWHQAALKNIATLLQEAQGQANANKIIGIAGDKPYQTLTTRTLKPREVLIAFEPDERARHEALNLLDRNIKDWPTGSVALFVPGSASAIPAENGFFDEFQVAVNKMPELHITSEAARTLKSNGKLVLDLNPECAKEQQFIDGFLNGLGLSPEGKQVAPFGTTRLIYRKRPELRPGPDSAP